MKRKHSKSTLCVSLVLITWLFGHDAFAGGLYSSEIGSPTSLGTAGVNNVVNNVGPDSAWTNPAGMTGVKKDTVMQGMQLIIPFVRFDADIAEAGGSNGGNVGIFTPVPSFYGVKVLSDQWRVGLAISAPLGGGADYGDDFVGRYQASRSTLGGVGISPALAYKVNEKLSLGIGVSALYSIMDADVMINQPGPIDGKLSINQIDDWGAQGYFGLTWRPSERALIGFVYRTESDTKLEGDLDLKNIQIPILNQLASRLDKIELDFDYPQLFSIGLKYMVSDKLALLFDADYEDWSAFSDFAVEISTVGPNTVIQDANIEWDDTWHVGAAFLYELGDNLWVSSGVGYDSSPVDDDDRNALLPADEQVRFSMAIAKVNPEKMSYSLGFTGLWLGDGKMDQTAQGARFKGEFSTNFIIFVGGQVTYRF